MPHQQSQYPLVLQVSLHGGLGDFWLNDLCTQQPYGLAAWPDFQHGSRAVYGGHKASDQVSTALRAASVTCLCGVSLYSAHPSYLLSENGTWLIFTDTSMSSTMRGAGQAAVILFFSPFFAKRGQQNPKLAFCDTLLNRSIRCVLAAGQAASVSLRQSTWPVISNTRSFYSSHLFFCTCTRLSLVRAF